MKKVFAAIFIIIILTSAGCTDQLGSKEEVFNLSNTSWGKMLETESGYYMSVEENMAYKLYYADKADISKWVPVCNKPDCPHEVAIFYNSGCNAYLGENLEHVLKIIDDKIYYFDDKHIMRMDMTGENHEEVRDLSFEGKRSGVWDTRMFHYDGKVFLARYSYTRKNMGFGNVEADSEWNSKLLIVEPESGEDIVLIDETQTGYFYDIRPLTRSKMNSQELYLAFYLHDYTLQRLGLEKVYQFEEESNTIIEVDKERSYSTLLGTIDGKEYHLVEGQGILCDDQVIIADDRVLLQGGMFQDKYLYITDGWCDEKKDGMAIYDLQGNLIGKIFEENCTEYNIAEILGYSDEHIFFRINHAAPMANEGVYETYAIDAQALAKGELKYTLFYEQYWIND